MIAIGFVAFVAIVGSVVFYFTSGTERGIGETVSGDFSVVSNVYGFDKFTVVDLLVENHNKSAIRFRSCKLMVPEEIDVYTDHLSVYNITRMVAYFGKTPTINYEFRFKCTYIKNDLDYEDDMTIRGPVVRPQPMEVTVDKSETGISGTVEEVAVKPRLYATFGVEPLKELIVTESRDLYRFSLTGDGKQRSLVLAFGGLDEAALIIT